MRFVDPVNRSPYAFLLEGKIVGLDELARQAKKTGKFDYDAKVAGLEASTLHAALQADGDRLQLPVHRSRTSPSAQSRAKSIEAYGERRHGASGRHRPVHAEGVDARARRSCSKRIPTIAASSGTSSRRTTRGTRRSSPTMNGKKMPQIGRVEITIIEEGQSRWLAFQQKELDYLNVAGDVRAEAFDARQAEAGAREQGISLYRVDRSRTSPTRFSISAIRVVGGFAKEKIALRRAIIMAYDLDEEIQVIARTRRCRRRCRSRRAWSGTIRATASINQYDPALANKLLDYFGYKKGADGWRTLPDGKPLMITLGDRPQRRSTASSTSCGKVDGCDRHPHGVRAWHRSPTTLKAAKACQLMMWRPAWTADYPDGDNFMQLLYGPNTGAEQQRLLRIEGVRRVLREVADAAPTPPSATGCSST